MASTRGIALGVMAAVLAAFVTVAPVAADWPTSCVALNDLAEEAAGRPHNVGIYQRVAGVNAEAACQHDHRADVQATFAWVWGNHLSTPVEGVWPSTCVALNDLAEAAAGRHQNVGLYQRVYGSDGGPGWIGSAESACRAEHRADVQQTFAWAAPFTSTPASASPPVHDPDYLRVRQVAEARGASPDKAAAVAASVVARAQVDAFLRGADAGVEYGLHACDWQSDACPLAPVYVPPPAPQIEPELQPAWDILRSIRLWDFFALQPGHDTVRVRFDTEQRFAVGNVSAAYHPRSHTILVNPARRHARPGVLAVTIAHELWHAVSPFAWPRDFDACVVDEVWAFILQGLAWHDIYGSGGPTDTDFEWSTWRAYDMLASYPQGVADFDGDVSDWPDMLSYVLFTRGYAERCVS